MSDYVVPPLATSGPTGPRASFFRRLGASLIDGIILIVISLILQAAGGKTLGTVLTIVIGIAYIGFFEGSASGQTVGKRVLGIRVIDYRTGGPIGYGRGASSGISPATSPRPSRACSAISGCCGTRSARRGTTS